MEECEDKIMSVKNELDNFFSKFLEKYQETPEGLPKMPKRKDIDQIIYVGDSDSAGYCRWKPMPYGQKDNFLRLMEVYGIEKNDEIVEYFCSYFFLGFSIVFKKHLIAMRAAEVIDGYKKLKQIIDAYTDQNGKITHIAIGVEQNTDDTVVVEVKTGIVKLVNDDTGKMRKIAPSLEEFIRGWEAVL